MLVITKLTMNSQYGDFTKQVDVDELTIWPDVAVSMIHEGLQIVSEEESFVKCGNGKVLSFSVDNEPHVFLFQLV